MINKKTAPLLGGAKGTVCVLSDHQKSFPDFHYSKRKLNCNPCPWVLSLRRRQSWRGFSFNANHLRAGGPICHLTGHKTVSAEALRNQFKSRRAGINRLFSHHLKAVSP